METHRTNMNEHMDVILTILNLLSNSQKAAVAKLVCNAVHKKLQQYRYINPADPDLPLTCSLDYLEHLQSIAETTWQQQTFLAAVAKQGDLPRLQYLRRHGCPWEQRVCVAAAEAGHVGILQWLRAQNPPCPWDAEVCQAAAVGGHFKVLQWLRAQDPPCPWDRYTVRAAVRAGDLEVLQWVLSADPPAPWDPNACIVAATEGHLYILKWVAAQQPPLPWDRKECLWYARLRSKTEVINWLETLVDI